MGSNRKQTKSGSTIKTGKDYKIMDIKKSAYDKPNPVSQAKDSSSSIDFKAVTDSQRTYTLPRDTETKLSIPHHVSEHPNK